MAYNINQQLVAESGRIGPDIYRRTLDTSPWLALIKQEPFPEELGDTISVLMFERSLPPYPLTWTNIGQSAGGAGGSCLPPTAEVDFAQTLRNYNLQHTALQSPPICVNDLRVAFKRKEQLTNMMEVLTENTREVWINRNRDEYSRISGHKSVVAAGLPESATAMPLTVPTSYLTANVLKKYYAHLIRDGAGMYAGGKENGRPIFTLITSSETSENMIFNDVNIRQDVRWSSKVDSLLAPLGVDRSYGGFYHVIDDLPPRYEFTAGAWVRKYPWLAFSATLGTGFNLDPAYESATYEDSYIFVDQVYTQLVPAPITAPGGGTNFSPVNYRGDFTWKNIQHQIDNPDNTIGFFRGIFASSSKPVRPFYGYQIRHLRCDVPQNQAVCAVS